MIVNFDQTGTKMVLVSEWTLEIRENKQIDIVGLDDKREVTSVSDLCRKDEKMPSQY